MTKADICNIEPVTSTELFEAMKLLTTAWGEEVESVQNSRWTVAGKAVK